MCACVCVCVCVCVYTFLLILQRLRGEDFSHEEYVCAVHQVYPAQFAVVCGHFPSLEVKLDIVVDLYLLSFFCKQKKMEVL